MSMKWLIVFGFVLLTRNALAERAKLPDLAVPYALGVNIHFTDPKPGEMKMLADGGFKSVRMDFAWGGIEREKGKYDFSAYDRLIASLQPHGIRAVFILDYSNHLYDDGLSPHTDEGRAAMAAFATAAVTHFKDKGIVWEMWNEPNIKQFWKPAPGADDYAKLAMAVGKAIRAAASDELYIGPATSTIDLKFLETCFKAGCLEYWDAVSVHPYRQKTPESVGDEYRNLRQLIATYAPRDRKIPILSGEWGYSAGWKNFDEERQAKYLPREFLANLYNEVPISIWYDWHDDGVDPKEAEHHFGTVHNAYQKDADPVYEPKPAYLAARALTSTLAGFKYDKRLAANDENDWLLMFSKGDEVRVAAWTTLKGEHEVTIPAGEGEFKIVNHIGSKTQIASVWNTGLKIKLSDNVQYIIPAKSNELLRDAAVFRPLKVTMLPQAGEDDRTIVVLLEDSMKQSEKLSVRLHENGKGMYWPDSAEECNLKPGTDVGYRTVEMGCSAMGSFTTAVEVKDARGNLVFNLPRRTYHIVTVGPLNWVKREYPDALHVIADGDNAVKSQQTISISDIPKEKGDPPFVPQSALKITYAFDPGWKFLELRTGVDEFHQIKGKPAYLGLWIRSDGSGNVVRARFIDSVGQTFQVTGPTLNFKGWKYVTIPMQGEDIAHWGKGDGEIHYPIRWDSQLLIDNASREKSAGEIWITGMMLVE